ncbi:uncharacterized protein METZ01_LOCUS330396 [marine metagenome]|uniref:Uncharacterized protein n=1 Tax=marine metagenome TaxID=408172 RepID=A0A382PZL2_9ZZZZ
MKAKLLCGSMACRIRRVTQPNKFSHLIACQ